MAKKRAGGELYCTPWPTPDAEGVSCIAPPGATASAPGGEPQITPRHCVEPADGVALTSLSHAEGAALALAWAAQHGEMTVGQALHYWRRGTGTPQTKAAKLLRISPGSLCTVEQGRQRLADARILRCTDERLSALLRAARIREYEQAITRLRQGAPCPPTASPSANSSPA